MKIDKIKPIPKYILQCYANGNTKPADDITTYINTKWLPYAKRQLKKIAA